MLTKNDAMTANEFHYGQCTRTVGPRGGITVHQVVYRRNGATQTWKTRPNEYRIPVKHGMRDYGQIRHYHADVVHTSANCPLR
jgi:hypothetical protein